MTKSLLAIIIIAAVALAGCSGERHNRAFGGLDSIAETSPGVAVARLDSLCGMLPGLNRADSACHHYREALRLVPGYDGGGLAASLRCRLAEACVASGDTAAARRLLLQARAADTPALKPRLALAEGFLLEAEGRADTALLRYGEAAAGGDAATRSAAYGRMAAVYGGRGDGHKAADCAARCVALADSLAASVSAVGVGGVANRRWAERRELESFFKELCFDYFTEIWLYVVSAIALVAFVGFRAFCHTGGNRCTKRKYATNMSLRAGWPPTRPRHNGAGPA